MNLFKYVSMVEGLSQRDLSELLDMPIANISYAFNTKVLPKKHLNKMEKAFDLPKELFSKNLTEETKFSTDILILEKKLQTTDFRNIDPTEIKFIANMNSVDYLCFIAETTKVQERRQFKMGTYKGKSKEHKDKFIRKLSKKYSVDYSLLNSPLNLATKWAIDISYIDYRYNGEYIPSNAVMKALSRFNEDAVQKILKNTPFRTVDNFLSKATLFSQSVMEKGDIESTFEENTNLILEEPDIKLEDNIIEENIKEKLKLEEPKIKKPISVIPLTSQVIEPKKSSLTIELEDEIDINKDTNYKQESLIIEENVSYQKNVVLLKELEEANSKIKALERELNKAYLYIGKLTLKEID